jgi:hypothetical protein
VTIGVRVALSLITALALGHFAATLFLLGHGSCLRRRLLRFGFSVPLGFGLVSFTYFIQRLVWAPSFASLLAGDAVMVACLAAASRFRSRRRSAQPAEHACEDSRFGVEFWLLGTLTALLVATSVATFLVRSIPNPSGYYDAWANWNMKAKFLFTPDGSRWRGLFDAAAPHPGYPLFLPCTVARAWTYAGCETPAAPIAMAFVATFSVVFLLFGAVLLLRGRTAALLGASVLLATSSFREVGRHQYADIPFALFTLGLGVVLLLVAGGDRDREYGLIGLAGLLSSMAAWTKNEGFLVGLAFLPCLLVAVPRASHGRARIAGVWLAAALPGLAIVILAKAQAAAPVDLFASRDWGAALHLLSVARLELIGKHVFGALLPAAGGQPLWLWLLDPVVLLGTACLAFGFDARRAFSRRMAPVLWMVLLVGAGYVAVYVITPHDLEWHLRTSASRLWMHLWPLVLCWACASVGRPAPPLG